MILAEKIFEQALDLPIDDRLSLIDRLINSTNFANYPAHALKNLKRMSEAN